MGRHKKNYVSPTEETTTTTPVVVVEEKSDLHPYTKLVKHNQLEFTTQYDWLIENGWILVEIKGNAYFFER